MVVSSALVVVSSALVVATECSGGCYRPPPTNVCSFFFTLFPLFILFPLSVFIHFFYHFFYIF